MSEPIPTGFAPAAPDDAPQGFRVLGAGDGLGTGDALQSQALAVQDPARAGRALALSEQTGIPRDAAMRQTETLDRRLRLAKATRALREANALRTRSVAARDPAGLEDADTLRAEIPPSALADAFADPVAGAAILEDLDGWLALRAEMARSPGSAAQNFDAGLELGRRSVRMGELAFRRASGDPAVEAEWKSLKGEVVAAREPMRAPAYLTPEQAESYQGLVENLSVRDRDGKLTFVNARQQPRGLALAARDVAQQVPILASLGTGAAIGVGIGGGVPLVVGTGVSAYTGNPAGIAIGAEVAKVGAAAGARIGAGAKAYPLNFGESLAMLEETTYLRPLEKAAPTAAEPFPFEGGYSEEKLPHEAVVAAAHLAAVVKTGLDLVGVEALIELIGARTVFSGATRGLRARLAAHLAKNPKAVSALVGMGRYLVSIGAETATEDLQTRIDYAAQAGAAATQQGEPVLQAAGAAAVGEEASEAAGEARRAAATSTAVLGPVIGAAGSLVRRAARIPRDRAEREKLDSILKEAGKLKLRETAPASFRALAQRLGEESGVDTTYMSADELLELFQDDAEGFRGLPEPVQREIEAALEQGRDAKLPLGVTLSVLAARGDARGAATPAPAEKPAAGGVAPGSAPRARLTPGARVKTPLGSGVVLDPGDSRVRRGIVAGRGPASGRNVLLDSGDVVLFHVNMLSGSDPQAAVSAPKIAPRLTPTQLTAEEEQELLGDLAAPDDALAAPRAPLVPPAAEAQFKRYREELVSAAHSPHDKKAADAIATLMRQATLTYAARRGISVEEAIERMPRLRFQGREGQRITPSHPALLDAPLRDVPGEQRLAALKRAVVDLRNPVAFEPKEKSPILALLKGHGGVDPTSTLGGELRNLGVTNRTLPGIFRRKGKPAKEGRAAPGSAAIDTLNKDEHPELFAGFPVQAGTNYLEPNAVLEAIRREIAGDPILSPEDAATRGALDEQRALLQDALAEANLDLAQVDDETAAQALYAMERQGLADELFQAPGRRSLRGETFFQPLFSRGEKKTTQATVGADKRRLIDLLGSTMYDKPLAQVATKELLQNAFDAVKATGRRGKITITVDESERTLTVQDNGVGMTQDTVREAFFTIGGTNKADLDVSQRSGGLGLAKMAFLFGSEWVDLETVRAGRIVKVHATSAQMRADDPFDIHEEPSSFTSGTRVVVKVPSTFRNANGETRSIYFSPAEVKAALDVPLLGDVEVEFAVSPSAQPVLLPMGVHSPISDLPKATRITFNWGTADLYVLPGKTLYPHMKVLSAGLYQFNRYVSGIGSDAILDIHPAVSPEDPRYPFNNQREGIRSTISPDIEAIDKFLKTQALGEKLRATSEMFSAVRAMPRVGFGESSSAEFTDAGLGAPVETLVAPPAEVAGEEFVRTIGESERRQRASMAAQADPETFALRRVDPKTLLFHNNTTADFLAGTPEESAAARAFFSALGSVVADLKEFIATLDDWDSIRDSAVGVSIDKASKGSYRGVSIRVPFHAFFLNPFNMSVRSLAGVAGEMFHTLEHEAIHEKVRGHNEEAMAQHANLAGQLAEFGVADGTRARLLDLLREHEPTFLRLREIYDAGTTENRGGSLSAQALGQTGDARGAGAPIADDAPPALREGRERDGGAGPPGGAERARDVLEAAFSQAFQGSPSKKLIGGKLSNEYIGTGENTRGQGWGHYLTSMRAVGEWYRRTLANDRTEMTYRGAAIAQVGPGIVRRHFEEIGRYERLSREHKQDATAVSLEVAERADAAAARLREPAAIAEGARREALSLLAGVIDRGVAPAAAIASEIEGRHLTLMRQRADLYERRARLAKLGGEKAASLDLLRYRELELEAEDALLAALREIDAEDFDVEWTGVLLKGQPLEELNTGTLETAVVTARGDDLVRNVVQRYLTREEAEDRAARWNAVGDAYAGISVAQDPEIGDWVVLEAPSTDEDMAAKVRERDLARSQLVDHARQVSAAEIGAFMQEGTSGEALPAFQAHAETRKKWKNAQERNQADAVAWRTTSRERAARFKEALAARERGEAIPFGTTLDARGDPSSSRNAAALVYILRIQQDAVDAARVAQSFAGVAETYRLLVEAVDSLQHGDVTYEQPGNVRRFEIPDETDLLAWNKTLAAHTPELLEKLAPALEKVGITRETLPEQSGRDLYYALEDSFAPGYTGNRGRHPGAREASEYLLSLGVPGHSYISNSRNKNFVLYSGDAARLEESYYQGPRQAGLFAGAGEISRDAERLLEHLRTAPDRTVSAIGAALELADPNAVADELAEEGLATLTASDLTPDPLGRQVALTKAGRERLGLDRRTDDGQRTLFQDATKSLAFRRWFGESKVVDEAGEPLVVYHGTRADSNIEAFDPGGIHFGTPEQAVKRQPSGAIIPAYLKAEKPRRMKDNGGPWNRAVEESKRRGFDSIVYLNRFEGIPREAFERAAAAVPKRKSDSTVHDTLEVLSDAEFRRLIPEARDSWIVFEPTQVKSTLNRGTFDPRDPRILEAPGNRGSITFSPDQREAIVRFSAAADLSTVLHELGHYYTLTLLREADALREQEPSAAWETQVLADADALLKAVGAEPGDTVSREQAEQLTDHFLAYLRTGKAPSEALRSAFGRFREWLVALYRSVRDLIGKEALPDDVRAVFDRLLATDEEIARQEGDAALGSIFAPGEVTPEEQATLEAAMAKARERVTNQVDRAQLLAMAKQRGIFERVEAERDRKEAEVRESIAAEVARDMAREPVWQADHYLRTGQLLGRATPEGLAAYKISRKALYSLFREDTPAGQAIKEVPTGQRSWLTASKAGVHPDTVAEQFGFASGADLVRALLAAGSKEAGSRERVAAEEVKRRLAAAGRLAAGELEERVLAALAGDSMADWLETQDKVLHAQIGDGPTPLQALRHQAERMLSETRVGDVLANRAAHDRSTLHRATAEREQRAARKAYKAGDRERAALHLQRVQLHRILERLSYAAKDEIRGALDLARRYRSSAEVRKRIGLSGDGRLDQIDGVLERVVLKAESDPETRRRRAPFIDWVRARMADGDQLAVPDLPGDPADPLYAEMPRWMREGMRVSYREMTLGEFRGMLATLKSIDHAARRELAVKIGEETRQREDVRRSLIAEVLSGTLRPATRLSTFNLVAFRWRNVLRALSEQDAARLGDRMFASARKADALATGKEALIWSIAGADPTTTIYQLFVGKLSAAEGQHGDRLRGMIEPLEKSHSRYLDKRGRDYLDETLPENRLQNRWKRAPFEVTRRNLLHVAYNVGNVGPGSNLTKLLGGYGWLDGRMVDDDPDGARAWIVGILDEHLDAEDWAHVQAVWDLLESFRDEVLGFEERMTGHAPEPITPAPFVTPRSAVKMRGGYFPVVYDPARSDAAALRQAEDILRTEAIGVGRIEPRHPYTKARTFLRSRALLIEGDEILFNHLESVSRDLAFREALLDIWKTINHEDVHQTMREVLGDEFSVVGWWKPWLQSIAGEQRTPSGLAPFQRAAYGLHHRAAAFTLLGRLTTILKQATGVANAVQQLSTQVTDDMLPAGVTAHVGLRHLVATRALIQATWRSFGAGNPAELLRVRREAMAKFPVLRGRLESYDREIKEVRNRVRGQTGGKAVLIEGAAKAIAWVQLHSVDIPLALAAYDLAKGRGLGESAAIASAETAVRVGEGSGSRLSQPVILTTFDGLASVFFGFLATYRFTSLNQVRAAWRTTHSPGAVLGALIFSAWVPSALGGAIALLWWGLSGQGGEPPEDEDWWQTISRNGLEGVADLIPGMTDLRRSIEREQVQVPGSAGVLYRELVAAGVDTVEAVQGEEDAFVKALFDAARLWALRHGLPGDYPLRTIEDVAADDEPSGSRRGSSRGGRGR